MGSKRDADSIFGQFPHIDLQASMDGKTMATRFGSMISRFLTEIARQSAKKNGEAKFLIKEPLVEQDPLDKFSLSFFLKPPALIEFKKEIAVLPRSGYVVLVLHPAEHWEYQMDEDGNFLLDRNGKPKVKKPLKFLFRLSDLYLQGYLSTKKWVLFSDVSLKGVIPGADINKFTMKLPFGSSYGKNGMEINFRTLQVGYDAFQSVYRVLSNSGRCYSQVQKQEALAVIAVTCSEATRRRCVFKWMITLFADKLLQNVDCAPSDLQEAPSASAAMESAESPPSSSDAKKAKQPPIQPASKKFLTWSNDCKLVREGLVLEEGISDEDKAKRQKEYQDARQDLDAEFHGCNQHELG